MNNVSFRNGVWVSSFDYDNRGIPKAAGFWWHGGNCRSGCKACAAGLGKVWWTPYAEKAALLRQHCDQSALQALDGHTQAVEASMATDADIDVPAPDGLSYLPFQRAGIAYAMGRQRTLIADAMGLGKTIQALGFVNAKDVKNVLVVAPASLRINWLREAERWLTRPFRFYVVDNPKLVPEDATFVVVNYDRLKGDVLESLMGRQWDLLVCDEAHMLKNEKAARTKAVFGVEGRPRKGVEAKPGLIDRASALLVLTGTPILNRPKEAYPLLHALDPRTWSNFFSFGKRYCAGHQEAVPMKGSRSKRLVWNFDGASNLEELQQRLRATIMVRRLKADVLKELPPKRRQIICLPANGAAKAVEDEWRGYRRSEEQMEQLQDQLELAQAAGDTDAYDQAVEKLRAAAKAAFEETSAVRKAVALAKLPAAIEYLKDLIDEQELPKLIVFGHHHDVIGGLAEAFGSQAVVVDGRTPNEKRQEAVDRFQTDPTCKVFVGGIRAAGVGLTLTAASTVAFVELDWTPGMMCQAEDRAHRIGQQNNVLVLHLVLDGSMDANMAKLLVAKQEVADAMLDKQPTLQVTLAPSSKPRTAHPAKYPVATESEREAAGMGLRLLAGRCDGARKEDGAGFSKIDTAIGHQLAERAGQRPLTDGEVWLAKRLCRTYRRQLPVEIVQTLGVEEKAA